MAAVVPAPGQAMYSATKLAMHGYFSTLQSELNDRRAPLNLCHRKPRLPMISGLGVATACNAASTALLYHMRPYVLLLVSFEVPGLEVGKFEGRVSIVFCACRGITVTIACPGPIATGTEGTPRNVFSAQVLTKPVHLSTVHSQPLTQSSCLLRTSMHAEKPLQGVRTCRSLIIR